MTFAPKTLTDLMAYWVAQGGVNLGIVGDTSHITKGTSYHLGQDDLLPGAYSAILPRDREPYLTNAAAATDLGKLDGSYTALRKFSEWLVAQALAGKCRDIREIIYCTSDGNYVKRWSGPDNKVYTSLRKTSTGWVVVTPGNGDSSHVTHTHISYYRDSESRPKVPLFSPYPGFAPLPGDAMPIFKAYATPKLVAIPTNGWIYVKADLSPDLGNIQINPGRDLPVAGTLADGTLIVGYRDTTPTEPIVPTYYFKGTPKDYPPPPAPPPVQVPPDALACKPFTDAALATLRAAYKAEEVAHSAKVAGI